MVEGSVETACKAVGMVPVCPGSSTCSYNSPKCLVTPLSSAGCSYLNSVADHICGNVNPKKCVAIDKMFVHMHAWSGGELGVVGQSYYAQGKSYVSGVGGVFYYAYCVICGDCTGDSQDSYHEYEDVHFTILAWSSWSTCGTNCKRTRTRSCTGGSECEQSETDEGECQDGNCDSSEYIIFIPGLCMELVSMKT